MSVRANIQLACKVVGAALGLAMSVGPALVAHEFPRAAGLEQLGAVALGGLLTLKTCRRKP
jgi:hypothetical protein